MLRDIILGHYRFQYYKQYNIGKSFHCSDLGRSYKDSDSYDDLADVEMASEDETD